MATYLRPEAEAVLLTDEQATAGVLGFEGRDFGVMLSHGATRLLQDAWFAGAPADLSSEQQEPSRKKFERKPRKPRISEVETFVRATKGMSLTGEKPRFGAPRTRRIDPLETLDLGGIRAFRVPAGELTSRAVGGVQVWLHRAERSLEPDIPRIDEVVAIDASLATLPPELMIRETASTVGNGCAGCAACAACAGCVFCAEVNFFVGAVGFVGLAGLVGLSSSFAIEVPSSL